MRRHFFTMLLLSICLIFCVFMLCGCQGNNSNVQGTVEELTFHNGLKFGMKKEDVVQFETTTNEAIIMDNWRRSGTLEALPDKGQVVGFNGKNFIEYFSFDNDDTLCTVVLSNGGASTDGYYDVIKKLTMKYGEPSAVNLKYIAYPSTGLTALDFSMSAQEFYDSHNRFYDSIHYYSNFRHIDSSQYFLKTKGGYIEIIALLDGYDYTSNDSFYSGTGPLYDYYISYSFISESEYEAFINKQTKKEIDLYNDL